MDGVVIDSEKLHIKALGLTLRENGISFPEDILFEFVGKSDRSFFEYARAHYDKDGILDIEKSLKQKDAFFDSLLMEVCLVDGVDAFIETVRSQGVKTALVTSSSRWTVDKVDELLGIRTWFDVVVAAEDTAKHKPDPAPYLLALESLKAARGTAIIIEDSPTGTAAGKAAGCFVIGITTSFSEEVLAAAGADLVVNSYEGFALPLTQFTSKAQ